MVQYRVLSFPPHLPEWIAIMTSSRSNARNRIGQIAAAAILTFLAYPQAAAAADKCFKDYGSKASFGSDDQVRALQLLAKEKCPIAGFTFKLGKLSNRSTLLAADLERAR